MEKDKKLAQVFHYDLYGKRQEKYNFLLNNNLQTVEWQKLEPQKPNYFFVPKDFSSQKEYEKGFNVQELFPVNSAGIVTARDAFAIHFTREEVEKTIVEFMQLDNETARKRFDLGNDVRDWAVSFAKNDLKSNYPKNGYFTKISYRPFDERWTFYTGKSKGFHCMPRGNVMQHFFKGKNIGLVFKRGFTENAAPIFISNYIIDFRSWSCAGMQGGDFIAPLYRYEDHFGTTEKVPNMNEEIVNEISRHCGLDPQSPENRDSNTQAIAGQARNDGKQIAPINIFDYIYAILHSPAYREKYKEFLKIDFPRVPFPENAEQFFKLAAFGEQLRKLHLLENITVPKNFANYPVSGSDSIEKPFFTRHSELVSESPENKGIAGQARNDGKVWINDTQYFDNVPEAAWNFYIGGYQPAQKWLKDRKGRKLNFDDTQHYQKIIYALAETAKIMEEIDSIPIVKKNIKLL